MIFVCLFVLQLLLFSFIILEVHIQHLWIGCQWSVLELLCACVVFTQTVKNILNIIFFELSLYQCIFILTQSILAVFLQNLNVYHDQTKSCFKYKYFESDACLQVYMYPIYYPILKTILLQFIIRYLLILSYILFSLFVNKKDSFLCIVIYF